MIFFPILYYFQSFKVLKFCYCLQGPEYKISNMIYIDLLLNIYSHSF